MYISPSFKGLWLVVLLAAFCFMGCSGGRPSSPEDMADQLLKSINTKDKAAFEALMCSKEVMNNVLEKSSMDEGEKAERQARLDNEYGEFMDDARSTWDEIMERTKASGMDKGDIALKNLEKDQETRDNVMGAEVELVVEAGGKTAKMEFVAVEHKGWWLLPNINFRVSGPDESAPAENQGEIVAPSGE